MNHRDEIIDMVNNIEDIKLIEYIYGIVKYCNRKYNNKNLPQEFATKSAKY